MVDVCGRRPLIDQKSKRKEIQKLLRVSCLSSILDTYTGVTRQSCVLQVKPNKREQPNVLAGKKAECNRSA